MKLHFPQRGRTVEVPENTRLSVVIRENFGEILPTPCGGRGTCGKCRVMVNNQPVLACQTTINSDLTVCLDGLNDDSCTKKMGILSLVMENVLKSGELSEETENAYTFAFDLGTTTLAGCLLYGKQIVATVVRPNPQRAFGADVISRIQYATLAEENRLTLQKILVSTIREMIDDIQAKGIQAKTAPFSYASIKSIVFAGNTTMEETLLGLPLDSLACAPFMPSEILKTDYSSQDSLWNGTLDFLPSDVRIRLFPVIGAFVGGDITAGVLTADILTARKNAMLLLDLGTNGEMVLETPTERFACATAAGPCFEGANISCGMCAESGAVTFIENRNGKFYAETLDNLPIRGICGSALIDLTAELLRIGLLTPDGRLLEPSELTNDFPSSWASHISATGFQLAEGIFVTPHDFRELQLAVGAIRTGIKLLLRRGGLDPQNLSHFLISGGFGSGVRMHNAQTIGLIPATISPQVFQFIGNSSLSGAVLATMSEDFWRTAHRIATETVCLDLSLEPDFSDVFMDSMTWEAY